MSTLICTLIIFFALDYCSSSETRLGIILHGNDYFAIRCSEGSLYWAAVAKKSLLFANTEQTWNEITVPGSGACYSNPALADNGKGLMPMAIQDTKGQVYVTSITIKDGDLSFGKWQLIGGKLQFVSDSQFLGHDNVIMKPFEDKIYTFARSHSNTSNLYWSALNDDLTSTAWNMLGGNSAKLMTDVSVVFNSFTKLLEAFVVGTDGFLYRSWQLSFDKWSLWDKTGYSSPKTRHAPVAHAMDSNIFNGRINVFVHGVDGKLHHIWQTTCDKVPNPWGWCTWSDWNTISGDIPQNSNYPTNSLSIGNNLHLGIEIYVVDADGHLFKSWQMGRHSKYSEWELVKSVREYSLASLPAIVNDQAGWWTAYGMDSRNNLIVVQQCRNITVSPSTVESSGFLTVAWNMPVDEASNMDWIAIYPHGGDNKMYLDYTYVGGSQNPTSEVVTDGHVSLVTYLPRGTYDVRYMVNRQFVAATGTSLTVTTGTKDPEWVQVFKGIFNGMNLTSVDIESCVKDARDVPLKFNDSFQAFRDRDIYKGLSLFGLALGDIVKGMVDCGVKDALTGRIKVFVEDLVKCAGAGQCSHFFVDAVKEVLVLYENVYEIYGDIRGASHCFGVKAYAQGGVNIGRVIGACIELPR